MTWGAVVMVGTISPLAVSAFSSRETVEPTPHFRLIEVPPSRELTPDGDGQDDEADLRFAFSAPASVAVTIRAAGPQAAPVIRSFALDTGAGDAVDVVWDGHDDDGRPAPDGDYLVAIAATDPRGATIGTKVPVTVSAGGPVVERIGPVEGDVLVGPVGLGFVERPGATVEDVTFWVDDFAHALPLMATSEQRWTTTWDPATVGAGGHTLWATVRWVDKWNVSHLYIDRGVQVTIPPGYGSDGVPVPLVVRVRGEEGDEQYEVLADGDLVGSGTATTEWATPSFELERRPTTVEVRFVNDHFVKRKVDRNLTVDWVSVGDLTLQTEDPSVQSTGTFADGACLPGNLQTETLHCNGSFTYQTRPVPEPHGASSTPS